jgi:hypothetical protein
MASTSAIATENAKGKQPAASEQYDELTDPGYDDDGAIGLADLYDQQQVIIELLQAGLAPQLRKMALDTKRAAAIADGPSCPGSAPAWFKAMAVRRADAPPAAHQIVTDAMLNAPDAGTRAKTAAAVYKALDAAGKRGVQAAYRSHIDMLDEPAIV